MSFSISSASLPVFAHMLGALDRILDKLALHCAAKKIDPVVILKSRLFPDMFDFTRQVQIACDFAKGGACRLAGREVPSFADDEASIDELKARIARLLALIASIPAADVDGAEARDITVTLRGQPVTLKGDAYLLNVVLPNFYFHLTAAYAILRHCGVELGKGDFLGR